MDSIAPQQPGSSGDEEREAALLSAASIDCFCQVLAA
jgi:hypothetical protein